MKSLCLRCKKEKLGVHEILLFGLPYFVCNHCASKIQNLLDMIKQSKNQSYIVKLEYICFHAVGFNEL